MLDLQANEKEPTMDNMQNMQNMAECAENIETGFVGSLWFAVYKCSEYEIISGGHANASDAIMETLYIAGWHHAPR